jgi:hypothetical protein
LTFVGSRASKGAVFLVLNHLLKQLPLLLPVDPVDNVTEVPLVDPSDIGQKQDLLLDIGSKMQELRDLPEPGQRSRTPLEAFSAGVKFWRPEVAIF